MSGRLIQFAIDLLTMNLSVTVAVAAALAVAGWQRGYLPESAATWAAVLGGGFLSGRHVGPAVVDMVLNWLVGVVSSIPVIGDLLTVVSL